MYNQKRRWRRINKMLNMSSKQNRQLVYIWKNVFKSHYPEWKYNSSHWVNKYGIKISYKALKKEEN